MKKRLLTIALLSVALTVTASAATEALHPAPGLGDYDLPFFPGGSYRPDVQSPGQFLGYTLGSKASSHAEIVSYFEYLAETLPNAMLHDYGLSHEGRRLVYLVIASEDNAPKLDDIRRGLSRLADPRKITKSSEAQDIIKNSPAVAWLAYGIHGDELSSCDAALYLAYQILAGRDDDTGLIRDELIVVIDPLQNPDGRTRWLSQLQQWNGVVPSHDVQSLHHRGTWPYARIHKVVEPRTLRDRDVEVTTYRFTYPDGPVDAEALMAAPDREQLWVISKEDGVGAEFALPSPMSPAQEPMVATRVGPARSQITDAAMAPDGTRYVVRDYLSAEVFSGEPPGEAQARFRLPLQPQGESVAWTADGRSLLVASERSGALIEVDVPRTALGTDSGVASVLPRVAGFDIYPYVRIAVLVLGGLVGLMLLGRANRRRRRRRAGLRR